MKAKLKKCKGFEGVTRCKCCARKDETQKETLIKSLVNSDNKTEMCMHFVFKKGDIRR